MTRDTWNMFVTSVPGGSFLQSWEWGQMQEKLGVPYWRLQQVDGIALVLGRQLPLGKSWLYVPRGPAFAEAPAGKPAGSILLGELIELAQREHAVFMRIEPKEVPDEDWHKAPNDVQPRHTLILDLTQSEEELLGEMHQKTRYNIRLAEKKGVHVRFSTDARDIDHFLALSADVHERSAFAYHPEEYYRAMHAALSPAGAFDIALAEYEGEVLAAHLLVYFGDTATYVHGASKSAKRELMAPHLLQWESIRRAKQKGFAKYDFFGVAPPASSPPRQYGGQADRGGDPARRNGGRGGGSEYPWAGITRFKEGFGGYRVSYPGAYDYVLDPVWYWTYSTGRKLHSFLR